MPARRTRRATVAVVACAAVILLTGCQATHRTALRLNEDGSLDFGTCHSLSGITGGTAVAYMRESGYGAGRGYLSADDLPEEIASGDVIHLPAPESEEWDQVQVVIEGDYTTRAGETIPSAVEGLFERSNLEVGEWSWARSGVIIGTVPIKECELIG